MITALLIDDSVLSNDALQVKLERHCPEISILQACTDPREAIEAIGRWHPDVIFLDVEMPGMNAFAMLQQLPVIDFEIIFVTAYNHYAIPAIRINALDYLEKPVNVKLLKEAVDRLQKRLTGQKEQKSSTETSVKKLLMALQHITQKTSSLALPSADGVEIIQTDDIVWMESVNNYTRFYLKNKQKLLISKTLGEYEERLKEHGFLRIHRSYLINLNYLHKYHRHDGGYVEMKTGELLEVAVRKRQELLDRLKEMG